MIEINKQVNLNYILRNADLSGDVIESTYDSKPLSFIYGQGKMLPKFEENIGQLNEGDSFSFELNPEEAYGIIQEAAVIEIPLNTFEANGSIDYDMVKVGNSIPMQDSKGQRMNGLVLALTDQSVKMDFNHPLAGKKLHFEGEILAVTEPVMEMAHEHGHEHGGDGCGCGSGCGC
ncbi:MAG: FKBP-type peptidyl-prolyl cis-trans isomerase [Bacteroidales bacterium]|nr:FKBP-type peptidyl-prolyl cis-trans isomerase [Bacteroidales bacterium]